MAQESSAGAHRLDAPPDHSHPRDDHPADDGREPPHVPVHPARCRLDRASHDHDPERHDHGLVGAHDDEHDPDDELRRAHSHGPASPHGHHHPVADPGSAAFRWSIVLNSLLTGLQLAIGFGFGSLALIGDALHNFGDVVGLLLGWGAERLSQRPPRGRFTFGFGRSTQLASLLNGLLVFSAGAVLVWEALQRLLQPQPMQPTPIALAAAVGIAINLISARLFGHADHDLNRRAAVLHLLTDAAVSAAVLASAVLVKLSGWLWLDPLTAIGVGLVVMASAWSLLREALAVSLDAAPRGIDLPGLERALLRLPGVVAVQDLHVWGVSTSRVALTAHLCRRRGISPADGAFLTLARAELARHGIHKSTLEVHADEP